jgi:tRNA U38,U39,U40 pseudouridine synthase TruA
MPKGSIKNLIKGKDRTNSGPTAKAAGLVLVRVGY